VYRLIHLTAARSTQRVVVTDKEEEAQGVSEVDVTEFGRGGEREVRVPGLEGALELGASVALGRHRATDVRTRGGTRKPAVD
jgi:hypothetical protein